MMYHYTCHVVRVVDGDTVDAVVDLGFSISRKERFRLYGLDAPELNTEFGRAVAQRLRERIEGKDLHVYTIKDRADKYGRMLGIFFDAVGNVNVWLIEEGLAMLYMAEMKDVIR